MTLRAASTTLVLAVLLSAHASVAGAFERPAITQADQPLRVLRGVAVYKGTSGVMVQKDDIVETGEGAGQLEMSADMMIMLAPQTRVYLASLGTAQAARLELVVLAGWVKLANKPGGANGRVTVITPLMRVTLDGGASIVHVSEGKSEMFAEDGAQTVAQVDGRGKPGAELKVGREQYALRPDGQSARVLARPPKEFMAEVPIPFRDPLTAAPDRLKGAKVAIVKLREAEFADIAPWLGADLALRKSLVSRYTARLADPTFRQQLDAQLGQSADWKPILHPPPPPLKPGH